jgi:hypothetical protein
VNEHRIRTSILVAVVAVAMVGLFALPAAADSYKVRDKIDQPRSALDIRWSSVGHKQGDLVHMIQLRRAFTPKDINPNKTGFLGVAFDTTGDGNVDYFALIFGGAKFAAAIVTQDGTLQGKGKIVRPNRRTIGVRFDPSLIGSPQGYLWFAFAQTITKTSCCFDYGSKFYFIHDLTPPQVTSGPTVDASSPTIDSANGTGTVDVDATVTDTGWSDSRLASARWRVNGDTTWTQGSSKKFALRKSLSGRLNPRGFHLPITLDQGGTYEACVSVADTAKNWISAGPTAAFQIPYDETNTGVFLINNGAHTPNASDYGGYHSALTTTGPGAATLNVPAGLETFVMVAPTGNAFQIHVTVNGSPGQDYTDADVSGGLLDISGAGTFNPAPGTDVIVITVTGGTEFDLDGYLGAPTPGPQMALGNCGGKPTPPTASRAKIAAPRVDRVASMAASALAALRATR